MITLVGVEDMNESFLATSAHLDYFIVCDADDKVYVGGITAADIKHSIKEHGNSVSVTGTILAHEIGHNLGT